MDEVTATFEYLQGFTSARTAMRTQTDPECPYPSSRVVEHERWWAGWDAMVAREAEWQSALASWR